MPKENALIKGLLRLPLYVRIAVALVLGVIVGLVVPATWAPTLTYQHGLFCDCLGR